MRGEWKLICDAIDAETPSLTKAWNSGVVVAQAVRHAPDRSRFFLTDSFRNKATARTKQMSQVAAVAITERMKPKSRDAVLTARREVIRVLI